MSPSNVPPSVTADSATVTVDEGAMAIQTGTFSDLDADTVALSASVGSILDNGVGTWSWSFDTSDGSDESQTVTITATDSDGAASTTTFELVVNNVAPTVALSGAASVAEGSTYTLTLGAVTDPGADTVTSFIVDWGDGKTDTYSTAGAVTHTYADGLSTPTITVDLVDEDGTHGAAGGLRLTVENVAPTDLTLALTATTIDENQSTSLSGSFVDPGTLDTHPVEIDWGDGSPVQTVNLAAGVVSFAGISHTYLDDNPTATPSDTYEINVTVTDDDGGSVATGYAEAVSLQWDFENAMSSGKISTSVGLSSDASLTGFASQTGGGPAENFPAPAGRVHLTRSLGTNHPYIEFSTTESITLDSLEFQHFHNHNSTYPTYPSYDVQLQIDMGSGFADIGSPLTLSPANYGETDSIALGSVILGPGTYQIRWDPRRLAYGVDTGTEFFALNDLTLNVTEVTTPPLTMTVNNVAPQLANVAVTPVIDENGLATLTGDIVDPGTQDTFTLTVDWGEGTAETFTYSAGTTSFSETHQYLDDNPTGTPSDVYAIGVTLTDDDAGTGSDTETVMVNNVAPTVTLDPVATIDENGIATLTGTITDPGTADTFVLDIDWGDPLSPDNTQTFTLAASPTGSQTFTRTHQYLDDNPSGTSQDTYTISAVVTDDDAGTGSDTETVMVNNVTPTVDIADMGSTDSPFVDVGATGGNVAINNAIGQSFRVDSPTDLTKISIWIEPALYYITSYHIELHDSEGPAGVIIGTTPTIAINPRNPVLYLPWYPAAAVPAYYDFEFLSPVSLEANRAYTFVLVRDSTYSGAFAENGNVYAGGQLYWLGDSPQPSDDMTFRLYGTAAVNEGDTCAIDGSFSDVGTADTWTATVDYGDGTGSQPLALNADKTFGLNHVYADNGTYSVTVTVTDDDGGVGTDSLTLTVDNVAPTVNAGADQTADEGSVVSLVPATFNDLGTADTHTATINWGDGTATEAGTVTEVPFGPPGSIAGMSGTVAGSHVYADDGTYTVTVTVIDDDGATATEEFTVTVANIAPALEAGADQTVDEGTFSTLDPAMFSDPGFDNPAGGTSEGFTATINWGDGTTEPAADITLIEVPGGEGVATTGTIQASHAYADNGVYTVTVTVTDDDGDEATDTRTVTVNNVAPTVDAGADQIVDEGTFITLAPATFSDPGFDNPAGGTSEGFTATINWGDGTTEPAADITLIEVPGAEGVLTTGTIQAGHAYADDGIYTVTVTLADDDGGVAVDTFAVTVNNVAPTLDAGPDQTVDEGAVISFTGSFGDAGLADTHTVAWSFGDGGTASGTLTPTHAYVDNGSYTVTLTVTDDEGAGTSDTLTVTVTNVAPVVEAGADQEADEGQAVSFSGLFSDVGLADTHSIAWDFGDGTTVEGTLTSTHAYADNGQYTVTLTVIDDDGAATADSLMVLVNSVAPVVTIDTLVTTTLGSTRYDLRTGRTSVLMTITNISETVICGPLWVVIMSISDPGVTLAGSSGFTSDGYWYVDASSLLSGGQLNPGQSVSVWLSFNNPLRKRFTFLYSIRGVI